MKKILLLLINLIYHIKFIVSIFLVLKEDKIEAFKFEEKYYTKINTSINEQYITKIEKL